MKLNRVTAMFASVVCVAIALQLSANAKDANTVKDGDKCKVSSGTNKGQSGTYSSGGKYCEGSWGATECTPVDGKSACTAAATKTIFNPIYNPMWGAYLKATAANADPSALDAWKAKYHATILSGTGTHATIKLPGRTVALDVSREGLEEQLKK
jgi:hypothetical protein